MARQWGCESIVLKVSLPEILYIKTGIQLLVRFIMNELDYIKLDKKIQDSIYYSLILFFIVLSIILISITHFWFEFIEYWVLAIIILFISIPGILIIYRSKYVNKYWLPKHDMILLPKFIILLSFATSIALVSLFIGIIHLLTKFLSNPPHMELYIRVLIVIICKIIIDYFIFKITKNLIKPYLNSQQKYFNVDLEKINDSINYILAKLKLDFYTKEKKVPVNQILSYQHEIKLKDFKIECYNSDNVFYGKSYVLINNLNKKNIDIVNKLKKELDILSNI